VPVPKSEATATRAVSITVMEQSVSGTSSSEERVQLA